MQAFFNKKNFCFIIPQNQENASSSSISQHSQKWLHLHLSSLSFLKHFHNLFSQYSIRKESKIECSSPLLSIPTEFIVEVTDPQELSPETLVGGQRIHSYFRTHFMELRSERRVLPYIILHHQEQNSNFKSLIIKISTYCN